MLGAGTLAAADVRDFVPLLLQVLGGEVDCVVFDYVGHWFRSSN